MHTSVAAQYARPMSPYLVPSSPSRSPSLAPRPSSSSATSPLPHSPTPDRRPPTRRATLSLDPRRDDPFAATPAPSSVGDGYEAALGGEEWRVSESLDRAQYTGPQEDPRRLLKPAGEDRFVRRRSSASSFLRSLARPLRSSIASATVIAPADVLTKQARRARSSVQLSRVSAPVPGSARGGTLRVRGSVELISVEEAVELRRSLVAQDSNASENAPEGRPPPPPPPPPPAPALKTALELHQSKSERSLGRRSSLGMLLFSWRASPPAATARPTVGAAIGSERPPMQSRKAHRILGGLFGSVKGNAPKLDPADVDVEDSDVVGLALTTDAPTLCIVPDNARYSFSTTGSSTGSPRSRMLASTTSSASSPAGTRLRGAATHLSCHADEGEDRIIQVLEAAPADAKPPLSPPPKIPLPPLPAGSASPLPRINLTAPTPGTTPTSHGSHRHPPLPPGLAPEPTPGSPSAPSAPSFVRRTPSCGFSICEQPHPPLSRPPPHSTTRPRSADDARGPQLHFSASLDSARGAQSSEVQMRPSTTHVSGPGRAPVSSADVPLASKASRTTAASTPEPLLSLYLVCGLPREPETWVEAEGSEGAPREGRRWKAVVLGMMEGANEGWGGEESVRRLEREEKEQVQAKALKLAFDRDVEVVTSPTQPPATTSFFSFATTRVSPPASTSPTVEQRYHCVSLLVWSHCDEARAPAVVALLLQPQEQRPTRAQVEAEAVRRGAKAARAGRQFSSQLLEQMNAQKADAGMSSETTTSAASETETGTETEGRSSLDLEEAPALSSPRTVEHLNGVSLWLPYHIVLVSTSPLYTVLSDVVRHSWARYHHNLAAHSLQMERMLNAPTPQPGELLKLPVSAADEPWETFFIATMPGDVDWFTSVTRGRNYPLWPVFKALHADNLLTIAELALAPFGKIVFTSEHRIMLSLATMTFQTILEMRGWKGLALPTVHARDVKLFLEDSGPWLLGLPTSPSTAALLLSLAPEISVVDLDANLVSCASPSQGAVSTGSAREKARKRLEAAVGSVGRNEVPLELVVAFPAGRYRPFSLVEINGELRHTDRVKPDLSWQWDESRVLKEFDAILADKSRGSAVGKRLRFNKAPRKSGELDGGLRQAPVVKSHAVTFVERRDVLEAEVTRANRRLQILMNQSTEWQRSFQVFKEFSERTSHESMELRLRLERERREARRLTAQLAEDRMHQAQLEESFEAVERAREHALQELTHVDEVRRNLEHQRTLIAEEIQSIVCAVDDETNPVFQAVEARLEALSQRSHTPSLTSPSSLSSCASSRLDRPQAYLPERYPAVIAEEDENGGTRELLEEEARLETMRLASQETIRVISSRLSIALQAASVVRNQFAPGLRLSQAASSVGTSSPSRSAESDATLVSTGALGSIQTPPSPEVPPSQKVQATSLTGSPPLGFNPKPLTLTPPVSPEQGEATPTPVPLFVTTRPQHRRVRARAHGHVRQQSSFGGASVLSSSSGSETSSEMTPLARLPPLSSAYSSPTDAAPGVGRGASQVAAPSHSTSAGTFAHSRSASALSQLSRLSTATTDDAQSFVSVSDGRAGHERSDCSVRSRAGTPASVCALDDAGMEADQLELDDLKHVPAAPLRAKGGHGRHDSCGIDAPPVALFTRLAPMRSGDESGDGGGRVRAVVERYEQRV
ncbi:hypothetical protein JCM3770_002616 [Rhodotorula araucariae]